jgi:hypothetical protein
MYLAFVMQIFETEEEFATYDCDVAFVEGAGFQLMWSV